MYQSHWGLREIPFRSRLDPRFFYQSPTHEEALARLHFLVDHRRRVGLLMGEGGSGKSLVLEVFAHELRRLGRPVAKVNLLGLEPEEMLWFLAAGFGLNPPRTAGLAALWRILEDRLVEYRYQQWAAVVVLDDADQAGEAVLGQIVRLAHLEFLSESPLVLVLSARPERMGRLGRTLLEMADLRIDLEPWQADETGRFVAASLAQAGRREPAFADEAIGRLHELSHGIPRRVSQLADLALAAGAGSELDQIDAATVEAAWRELGGASEMAM